ncbi:Cas10/Cmr2 second palm domain-containing protein [Actinomyces bouchesdurhonensis]|uniref:Cas10/Cmr2 second palm domain-containing protein n=1 Tax=Actinomyces bouchesdurhonensis TaxID=1852361 RepID=UPI003AF0AC77
MTSYLVMLQTNSNQPFIFSSPRLREQIGASFEITLLSHWVKEEAEKLLKPKPLPASFWVSDSSGKVIVRFTEKEGEPGALAKQLITQVTRRALTDAPGLDVTGVFIEATFDIVDARDLNKLDRVFLDYSLNRRPAAARFPQFPFLERADESALPAVTPLTKPDTKRIYKTARAVGVKESYEGRAKLKEQKKQENAEGSQSTVLIDFNSFLYTATKEDAKPEYKLSLPARFKRAWALPARFKQLDDVSGQLKTSMADLYRDPTRLEAAFQEAVVVEQEIVLEGEAPEDPQTIQETTPPALSSVGVVHVDGNGVGAIMRDLGEAFKETDNTLDKLAEAPYPRDSNPCGKKPPRVCPNNKKPPRFQWFIMEVNYRLDGVVKAAVAAAWKDIEDYAHGRQAPPVVPVLVGGDDLTVYVEGKFAIPFAEAYIRHYEELTEKDELLKQLAVVAGAKKPGPLTASAGVAIVGRNFPFHIAYDLAEELVSRGKKLGKKKDTVPCSTINFHVLRDATVLDPDDTLDEYKGRSQRPFLIGHYAPERIGDATTTSSEETPAAKPQPLSSWARILQAVAAFDGKKPDDPTQTTGDPFPRARANRIVKLLAKYVNVPKDDKARSECLGYVLKDNEQAFATQEQIDNDKQKPDDDKQKSDDVKRLTKRCNHPICTIRLEWTDAQENARGTKALVKALGVLPSKTRLDDPDKHTEDCIEQVRWLLDLIDLSENLPDRYLASRIRDDADRVDPEEAADKSIAGGAQ